MSTGTPTGRPRAAMRIVALALAVGLLPACSSRTYLVDDDDDALARFMAAGPVIPEIDQEALLDSLPSPGPYRVVPGDVLEIRAPGTFFETAAGQETGAPGTHVTRVDTEGAIRVPLAGELAASGRTLPEIESAIAEAVHPRYLKQRPSILVRVEEHHTVAVSVFGAVETPGIHYLRSDQMSLFGALGEAGGILHSGSLVVGARMIRIQRPGDAAASKPIVLPVKGLKVPYSDVLLHGGERIEVERYEPDTFTVIGLVQRPGAFAYPPEVTYNLMQALAIAGGIDRIANPPYATIFRRAEDGTILPATFEIQGDGLIRASSLPIKPGDVIAVQHTPASWTRAFLSEILNLQIGFVLREDV
ncbi:MAG: hypothetical protein GY711_15955 [bacterium]|nr:hypothetical protein [bacterium]